ncbi:MAG: cytochrome c3 family protein [Thermoanaerobaculia bacterium]
MRRCSQSGRGRAQLARFVLGTLGTLGALALSAGCSTAKHHRVLSFFFDGVPEPGAVVVSAAPAVQASVGRKLVQTGEHGPYAAKLCDSCHDSKAASALVVPAEELCLRCHQFGAAKAYVHGPLASGGCLVCHDPHQSPNRYLLVSASDGFCLDCHDRAALSTIGEAGGPNGHGGEAANCTDCHEAHMSDRKYLLRPGV